LSVPGIVLVGAGCPGGTGVHPGGSVTTGAVPTGAVGGGASGLLYVVGGAATVDDVVVDDVGSAGISCPAALPPVATATAASPATANDARYRLECFTMTSSSLT
jgi:hypothetical protein